MFCYAVNNAFSTVRIHTLIAVVAVATRGDAGCKHLIPRLVAAYPTTNLLDDTYPSWPNVRPASNEDTPLFRVCESVLKMVIRRICIIASEGF